jgi:soluble lytic murein transglycosylase-like protein
MALLAVLAMLLLGVASRPAHADLYVFVDERGIKHITNCPSGPEYRVLRRTGDDARCASVGQPRKRFVKLVNEVAGRFGLEASLIHAVIAVESGYDPRAVSSAGAEGLMQLMPDTARRFGVTNTYDPRQNVYAGARYLKQLLGQFDDLYLALAAYNAGEGAVIRHGNRIPPYDETRNYVRKVMEYYWDYRRSS